MNALLDRFNRLSDAQRARFIGYLLGGEVPEALAHEATKALIYAESIPSGGNQGERPHQALARHAREGRRERGEGL